MTLIYNGGDMLSTANQAAHAEENRLLKQLGFQVYSPQDDATINDKTNQIVESNNSLAEKIFDRDTTGMERPISSFLKCQTTMWALRRRSASGPCRNGFNQRVNAIFSILTTSGGPASPKSVIGGRGQ